MCVDNLRASSAAADHHGFFVRIDMENARYIPPRIEIFETVWPPRQPERRRRLQSCLHRTEEDFVRVNATGARIRW